MICTKLQAHILNVRHIKDSGTHHIRADCHFVHLLYSKQRGFRSGLSTVIQFIMVVHDITSTFN